MEYRSKIVTVYCIPRMENHISYEYIQDTINKINIGKVLKIIEIPLKTESNYKRVLIHLIQQRPNHDHTDTDIINERLCSGRDIKIIHNMPWYWKMMIGKPKIESIRTY